MRANHLDVAKSLPVVLQITTTTTSVPKLRKDSNRKLNTYSHCTELETIIKNRKVIQLKMDEHQTTLGSNSSDAASDDLSNVSIECAASGFSLQFINLVKKNQFEEATSGDGHRQMSKCNEITISHTKKKMIRFECDFHSVVVHSPLSICVAYSLLIV